MSATKSVAKMSIITKCPFLWMFEITDVATAADDALVLKYKFDNASAVTFKSLAAGSSAASTENIDLTRADGAIFRFPKENLIIDAITETQIASDTGGADASGLGEISATLQEAPVGTSTSWTSFVAELNANKDKKWLVIVGTGYSYERTGTDSTRKPDGYAYMIGKISSDIDASEGNVALTFASQKASGWEVDATEMTTAFSAAGIDLKRGGTGYDVDKTLNVPVSLVAADITDLKAGKIVLKEVTAA